MKNKTVMILGSTGMLGRYMSKYLQESFKIINISRAHLNAENANKDKILDLIDNNVTTADKPDVVINCIGVIKSQIDKNTTAQTIKVNSLFPHLLAEAAESISTPLIHITTDCIYSGKKDHSLAYNETDALDVSDTYGVTKGLGEPTNCTVIRTSIIGEEVNQARSLIEWVKSEDGNNVNGFTDHWWNGVTCLQLAKITEEIIDTNNFWSGTRHVFSNSVSKDQLVAMIADALGITVTITPGPSPSPCNRQLSSIHKLPFNIPSLSEQLKQLRGFSATLYS
tara:strand:+ start:7815 stop:8657 length:843 start_codon:yes stop_codon:yes gene_type:complete